MKHLTLTVLLIAVTFVGFAQTNENQSYSKAKIYLKDHNAFIVKNLKMNSIEASFLNSTNKKKETLSMNLVNFVKVKKGSHLWDGAIYGSLVMTLSAVLTDVENDLLTNPRRYGATEYIGFALIGAGLGALIGSLFPKWADVYSNNKFIGQNLPFEIDFRTSTDLATIKITIPI